MAQRLDGKVAIVTGGASGLGRATVERFVEEGAQVVLADLDADGGEALAASLGPAAAFRRTDVSDRDQVQALVDFAVERFGGLHVMMNNAGIPGQRFGRFLDDPLSDFQHVMGVNLFGVMVGTQCAARYMAEQGGGAIINTASIAALQPGFGVQTYRASKAAVVEFSRSMAIDLAEYGVRVNCIAPGNIMTPMTARLDPGMSAEVAGRVTQALAQVRMSIQPMKRPGKPQDVAAAAVYLASDEAAGVTGVVLPVDSGITAGSPTNLFDAIVEARAKAITEQ
jgi:NAD(P)-dependent dehydrogenase (short-subunit alcohol dehydrogenase family)